MHETYLSPFFIEMNKIFPNEWCVLHSYETLPKYSESDVDMAFSSNDVAKLEALILKIAKANDWCVYQKLWYDVETCFYYVLKKEGSNIFLALDFLMDNSGIGRYGFTTKILTTDTVFYKNNFPIPNPEVAFGYKLVKRIEKKRSLEEDGAYLKKQYANADITKVNAFLMAQFGVTGKELITDYLRGNKSLSQYNLVYLKKERKKRTSNFLTLIKYIFWETRRTGARILQPRGLQITIPILDEAELVRFKELLEKKVAILFRFVKENKGNSIKNTFIAMSGSTLLIRQKTNYTGKRAISYNWFSSCSIDLSQFKNQHKDMDYLVQVYYDAILNGLSLKLPENFRN